MKQLHNFLLLLIYTMTMIFSFVVYGKQQNVNIELKNKVDYLELQLQETEDRCSRMTDACINILVNECWN